MAEPNNQDAHVQCSTPAADPRLATALLRADLPAEVIAVVLGNAGRMWGAERATLKFLAGQVKSLASFPTRWESWVAALLGEHAAVWDIPLKQARVGSRSPF